MKSKKIIFLLSAIMMAMIVLFSTMMIVFSINHKELQNKHSELQAAYNELQTKYENALEYQLIPCPICGGEMEIQEYPLFFEAQCTECGLKTDYFNTKKALVEYWNRGDVKN